MIFCYENVNNRLDVNLCFNKASEFALTYTKLSVKKKTQGCLLFLYNQELCLNTIIGNVKNSRVK